MKKIILIIVAVFTFTITKATYTSDSATNYTNSETYADAPTYWSGWASDNIACPDMEIFIKVYNSPNSCNSYYAVASQVKKYSLNRVTKQYDINETLVVKERNDGEYYVTYNGKNLFFRM